MVKRPDIKTRKKLRITMCILYLLQIVICTLPFFKDTNINEVGLVTEVSPFSMFIILFNVTSPLDSSIITISVICIALIVIPIIGFMFCAFDKQRNLKNIVSALCCFTGVLLITILLGNAKEVADFGAIFAILLYVILMLITSMAMVMRLSKDEEDVKEPKKKKIRKEDRIY